MAEPRTPQDQIDDASAPLDDLDHQRLARVERSLARALALRDWWVGKAGKWIQEYDGDELAKVVTSGTHPDCFPLTQALPFGGKTEANYGFFDEAPIDGRSRPVMGIVQQTFFDQPKRHFVEQARNAAKALDGWRNGLRAFVEEYLIRLTGFYEPSPYVDPQKRTFEPWLRPFSWCPSDEERRSGFGFSQFYYKRRDTGRIGKFREADRARIDPRTLKDTFEWIVVGIRIHDLHLRHPAVGFLAFPINDEVFAVMADALIVKDDKPAQPGLLGRYGFGYAVLEDPPPEGAAVAWQRPAFGFQLNLFVIQKDGRVLARVTTVTDKLTWLVALNPWEWGRTVADRASLGLFVPTLNIGLGMIDRAAPGLFAESMRPVTQIMLGSSAGPQLSPLSALVTLVNSLPFDFAAKQLCISQDAVIRSLLSDLVRSQLSTIIASRGLWRAVPDWADEANIPAWARA